MKILSIIIAVIFALALVSAILVTTINVTMNVSLLEPISPTDKDVEYVFSELHVGPVYVHSIIDVNNAASVNHNVTVSFVESSRTPQCGSSTYTPNMPFEQELINGTNIIDTMMTCTGACQTGGCTIYGNVNITRI